VLEEGTNTAGGYTVPTPLLPQFIDALRAQSVFVKAGAQTMMFDSQTVRIARVDSDPTAGWRAENEAITISDTTFGAVNLTARMLECTVKISIELLQDSINIAEILQQVLTQTLALELDRAALFGSGSSNEPLGLFNTPNVNTVSFGTNGATPTSWDEFLDAIYEVESRNAAFPTAYIWHPRTAKTYRKLKNTLNVQLLMPEPLDQIPMLSTTSVPIDQTQGSASTCSTVLMGDFSQAILGMRQQLVIRRLDETFAGNMQVAFQAWLRADVAFRHPQ